MKYLKSSELHKPFTQLIKGLKHNILDELSEIFEQHGSAVHVEALAGLARVLSDKRAQASVII